MDKKLLAILVCPVTHKGLSVAPASLLKNVNSAIDEGRLERRDGQAVSVALDEALITDDGKLLYPVSDGIPVLLEDQSIRLDQLETP